MRFLPCGELMPVLPPTEESTWASSEVGIWTKSMPRRVIGGGKAGEIADDAAAEREDDVAALEPGLEQAFDDLVRAGRWIWSTSPLGTTMAAVLEAGRVERAGEARQLRRWRLRCR